MHNHKHPLTLGSLPAGIGIVVVVVGAMVLAGWIADSETLKSLSAGWPSMKVNTAIGFCAAGAALACSTVASRWPRRLAAALALFLIILSSLTLLQYLIGGNLGIDQMLMVDHSPLLRSTHQGRMAPTTAFCFLIGGLALFMANRPRTARAKAPLVLAFGCALGLIGGIGVVGYLIEALLGYHWLSYTGMAAHTAVAFTFVGAGILFLALDHWPLRGWAMDRPTTWVFVIAIILMLQAMALAYYFTGQLKQTGDRFSERQETLKSVQSLFASVAALENSQRGFVITGKEELLAERDDMNAESRAILIDLRARLAGNPEQVRRLDQLETLFTRRNAWEEKTLQVRRQSAEEAAALISTGEGMRLSRQLKEMLQLLEREEYAQLAVEKQAADTSATMAFLLLPVGGFLTMTILTTGLFQLNAGMQERVETVQRMQQITDSMPGLVGQVDRELRFRFANAGYQRWLGLNPRDVIGRTMEEVFGPETFHRAEPRVRQALAGERQEYEDQVTAADGRKIDLQVTLLPDVDADGTVKGLLIVAMDITQRKHAEEAIRQMNIDLEHRVDERTAELEATNQELEAFSYSVSHDLRAPLRAVDGFSRAVEEDYGPQLPEEGQRYLATIRKGAQQMGALIDDLLTFSRLSRLPMNRQSIDMEAMVRQALIELDVEESGAEIRIGDLGFGLADTALLRQVWINLLSNAFKYSRKKAEPVVEIGFQSGDEPTWYVRDNGTGFDMRYAGKLFGVFQRLHRAEEYEGTGVGLALVQRIIHRHGGRLWCEAAVDQGATFYFTLGKDHPHESQ